MFLSAVYHFGFYCTKNVAIWWLAPAAVLADLCKLPFLLAFDAIFNMYNNVLFPIASGLKNIFNITISPQMFEFMCKALVFVVPLAILSFGAYCIYKLVSGVSIIEDCKSIGVRIVSGLERIISTDILAATLVGITIGVAIASNGSQCVNLTA